MKIIIFHLTEKNTIEKKIINNTKYNTATIRVEILRNY